VFSNCGVGLVSGDGLGVLALVHAELGVVVEYPKHSVLDYDGDALVGVYTADTEPLMSAFTEFPTCSGVTLT
jgi:hypothetical protein